MILLRLLRLLRLLLTTPHESVAAVDAMNRRSQGWDVRWQWRRRARVDGKARHLADGNVGSSSSALGRGAIFRIADGISEEFAIIVIAELIVDEVFAQSAGQLVSKVVSNRRLGIEQVLVVVASLRIWSGQVLMGSNATEEAASHCRRHCIVRREPIANARLRTSDRRRKRVNVGGGIWAGQGNGVRRHSVRRRIGRRAQDINQHAAAVVHVKTATKIGLGFKRAVHGLEAQNSRAIGQVVRIVRQELDTDQLI